jgi:hypothetical protein
VSIGLFIIDKYSSISSASLSDPENNDGRRDMPWRKMTEQLTG